MQKKYIFVDLDGTILDHKTHLVPESTKLAIQRAKENGHTVVLTTGRPPSLFYGIDKELNLDSFIAANGRVAVSQGEIIFESPIPLETIELVVDIAKKHKLDIAFESMDEFVLETKYDDLYIKFCDYFNLQYPSFQSGYYKDHVIYQMCLFYDQEDFKKFEKMVPSLSFEFSCKYGIDVNTPGGFKEVGIKEFMKKFKLSQKDIIVIGDGFNDISMLQFAETSVAMGNAHQDVKKHAKYITDHIDDDGLYKAFKMFNLI